MLRAGLAKGIADAGRRAVLVAGILLLSACIGVSGSKAGRREGIVFENFRMSPDGRVVAFEFGDLRAGGKDSQARGLGLLEWRTGRLTRIPNPPGKKLIAPSWSEDGKRLAAAMGGLEALYANQIVIVDLADFSVHPVIGKPYVKGETGHRHLSLPVFQPGTGAILYVEKEWGAIPAHLHLFNPADGSDRVVLSREDGFWASLYPPSFIGRDEIVFQAEGTNNKELGKVIAEMAASPNSEMAYRLKFGEKLRFLFPHLERRKFTSEPGLGSLTATTDGSMIIVIGLSLDEPENKNGKFNYDLFRVEDGSLRPLTNIKTYLSIASIASHGSAIAFGSDPDRVRRLDLFILDMKTGHVFATDLLKRIEADPQFQLSRERGSE